MRCIKTRDYERLFVNAQEPSVFDNRTSWTAYIRGDGDTAEFKHFNPRNFSSFLFKICLMGEHQEIIRVGGGAVLRNTRRI